MGSEMCIRDRHHHLHCHECPHRKREKDQCPDVYSDNPLHREIYLPLIEVFPTNQPTGFGHTMYPLYQTAVKRVFYMLCSLQANSSASILYTATYAAIRSVNSKCFLSWHSMKIVRIFFFSSLSFTTDTGPLPMMLW